MTEQLKISASEATPGDKSEFPGMFTEDGTPWHYLDSAATAQKPQIVLDSVAWALGEGYATVHRGVYSRSARMTMGYEAARRRVAAFISAAQDELIFTRGATEAINLVAYSYPKKGRVLLSQLEHHSNIVPWQLAGWQVDVCPLTEDGKIDLDAAERILTPEHEMVAFAHVSNVLGSVLDAPRAAELAHAVGAKLLLDGCQAAPRLPVFVDEIGCDFYAMSAHKMYGPTGVGALWGRKELLESMPPWQGGGSMIDKVTFEQTTFAPPPQRFEAGTPAIAEAYAAAGAEVTLCARTGAEVEAVAKALTDQGFKADALVADVTDIAGFAALIAQRPAFDVFVNNAGTNRPKPLSEVSEDDYDAVIDLNVKAAIFAAQAVSEQMVENGTKGSIINMSSQMGHVGAANRTLYCASKWAIEGFTKALAVELGPKGIRVNTICPTFTETPMTKPFFEDQAFLDSVLAKIKLGRIGQVGDITGAAVFLASDASSLMTGSAMMLDGGWTAD